VSTDRTAPPDGALARLLDRAAQVPASRLSQVVDVVAAALGADRARVLVADYGLLSLQELGAHGPTGASEPIDGTLAGRSFISGETISTGSAPTMVWVPLSEGSERLGVLELAHGSWDDTDQELLRAAVQVLVLVLVGKRRYTDAVLRSRRSEPLSVAAELQWDLLPPLTCSTEEVSVSGILEPAYSIGGDSFDYALNANTVELSIIDAVGHGLPAVMTSVAAINCLRNARREGEGLETAYLRTAEVIESQFGESTFVTAQLCALALDTGELTWLNAGHPLPLLVRDGSYLGELSCLPSTPMGVGGPVTEIATEQLQRGDRVLFYTDGVVETRAPGGEAFGVPRLADFLVRATLDGVAPAETVRRLSASIMKYNGAGLTDDATLLLLEYHGPGT
jgi:serine phosphatase RsbU (regulator of sigma subunit)